MDTHGAAAAGDATPEDSDENRPEVSETDQAE